MQDHISTTDPNVAAHIESIQSVLSNKLENPEVASMIFLGDTIAKEAFVIAINNLFVIIALLFLSGTLLLPFTNVTQNKTDNSNAH